MEKGPVSIVCVTVIVVVVVLLIIHSCDWEPQYNSDIEPGTYRNDEFDSSVWFNYDADLYFGYSGNFNGSTRPQVLD